MSLQSEYDSLQSTFPVVSFKTQTMVECKLLNTSEFSSLLAVNAVTALGSVDVSSGEFTYHAKLSLSVMYLNPEGKACRIERGAEFSQTVEHELIAPAHRVRVSFRILKLSPRREGTNVYLSAILQPEIEVYTAGEVNFLSGGDYVTKQEDLPFYRLLLAQGEMETEDSFDAGYISDILLHTESVSVRGVECTGGALVVSGDVSLGITAVKEEEFCFFERLIPFRAELPCEDATRGAFAEASVSVRAVHLTADTDESRGKSTVSAVVTLDLRGCVYERSVLHAVTDAFAATEEVIPVPERRQLTYPVSVSTCNERVVSVAAIDETVDFSCTLLGAVGVSVSSECTKTPSGVRVEGVIEGRLLVKDADGGLRGIPFTLPYTVEERLAPVAFYRAEGILCGVSARQKREGEVEIEGTLKLTVVSYAEEEIEYLADVRAGEPLAPNQSAVSVYIPRAGDTLWDTAKRLRLPPEEVQRENPSLTFPLTGKERIFVYRQNRVEF